MKELLTEFFASILGEAKEVKKPSNAKVSKGGKWYTADPESGGVYVGRVSDGKWIDPTPEENQADKERRASQKPATQKKVTAKKVPAGRKGARKRRTAAGAIELETPVTTRGGRKISAVVPMGQHTPPHEKVSNDLPDRSKKEAEQYARTRLPESNKQYYERMRKQAGQSAVRESPRHFPPSIRDTLTAAGVPEHHIQILERAANTRRISDSVPKLSNMVSADGSVEVGAGQNRSQIGEILALTLLAIQPKTERDKVAQAIRKMVGDDKDTLIDVHGKSKNGKDSWLSSAERQADAFTAMMDNQYGEGNWQIEATAWDTPGDITGIGLTQKNKGFSTDVAIRVRVQGQSKSQAVRLSLKKDGKIFLLNGTTNDMVTFALQSLPPKEKEEAAAINRALDILGSQESTDEEKKQAMLQLRTVLKLDTSTKDASVKDLAKARRKELTDKAIAILKNKNPRAARAVQKIVDFPYTQQKSAVKLGLEVKKAKPMTKAQEKEAVAAWNKRRKAVSASAQELSPEDIKLARAAHKALRELKCGNSCTQDDVVTALMAAGVMPQSAKKDANLDRMRKAVLFAAELEAYRNGSVAASVKSHKNIAVQAGNAAIEATVEDSRLKAGMMLKLQETFPIQVIASGEETMCLGGVPINKATLESMFGTSNPKEIQEGLAVEIDPETGEKILVFIAGGKPPKGRRVAIANVKARQKGIGYDNSIGLEFEARADFECAAAIANTKTDPPMNSESNQEIVTKCEKKNVQKQSDKPKKKR